jgi:hypothetical protein
VRAPAREWSSCGRGRGDIEPPTIYPPHTEKAYLGFAIVEIAPRQLSITFYDKAGTQTGGPFTIT